MPTSASTGTGQVSTAGKTAKPKAKDLDVKDEAVANTELVDNAGSDRNTPDGAPVVTSEADVVGGVRVDLPPSAPASDSVDVPSTQGGTVQVARPDGTFANVNTDDEDWEDHAEAIRKGERNF